MSQVLKNRLGADSFGRPLNLLADVTFVRTVSGFAYVVLVVDGAERTVVGWDVSDDVVDNIVSATIDRSLAAAQDGRFAVVRCSRHCCFDTGCARFELATDADEHALAGLVRSFKTGLVHHHRPFTGDEELRHDIAIWVDALNQNGALAESDPTYRQHDDLLQNLANVRVTRSWRFSRGGWAGARSWLR